MNMNQNIKSWLLAALVAMFLSACATTDETISTEGDGAPMDGQAQDGSSSGTTGGDSAGGAAATGLYGSDGGDGTAIADDSSRAMSATAKLE